MSKRARESFVVRNLNGGGPRVVRRGELFSDDHPYVADNPAKFVDIEVETATAAPGEKRKVTRKKTTVKDVD